MLTMAIVSTSFATDPALLNEYKSNILAELENSYADVDVTYTARFITFTESQTASLNKPVSVYYDGAKAYWELNELFHDRTGYTTEQNATLDKLPEYIEKCKRIIAVRSAAVGGGGYMNFPHGLAYWYQQTGDTEARDGLIGLRDIGGGLVKAGTITNERIEYSRDIAYTLQAFINTYKMGLIKTTAPDHETSLAWFLSMVKSHVAQWGTGNFYYDPAATYTEYMCPFIAGLSMSALIEYYERVYPDTSIPPLIKTVIDRIWNEAWWPDIGNPYPTTFVDINGISDTYAYYATRYIAGYGAVWHWLNWNESTQSYDIDANNMPSASDVSPDNNMLALDAFAWYAAYSKDPVYISRAEQIFNGTVKNSDLTASYRIFEGGARSIGQFIKHYRQYYDTGCSINTVDVCSTQLDCESVGAYWTGERCQYTPVVFQAYTGENPLTCATLPSLCATSETCTGAGFNWCTDTCQAGVCAGVAQGFFSSSGIGAFNQSGEASFTK